MCSLGDDNIEDLETLKYMPTLEKLSLTGKCNKCKEEPPCVVLRSKDKYCKSCFLSGATHKFKSLLGKHKLIRPNENVLLVHNGGHSSTALMHLVRTGIDLETHKKLRFNANVLFIEDKLHLTVEERRKLLRDIENEAKTFNFAFYFASITEIIANNIQIYTNSESLQLSDEDRPFYDNFLRIQKNKSNKNDFMRIILRNGIVEIAKKLNSTFVFTTEISSDVASELLCDISLGRGFQIPLNTGFCDFRVGSVKILKPMRLFDSKELAFYNFFHNLEPVTFREKSFNQYESVQSLMKKFITDLQVNYPATVTTVLKTGDKLGIDEKLTEKCEFCNAFLTEENQHELSSAESTEFSHWVSIQAPDYSETPQKRYSNVLASFNQETSKKLCFSCKKFKK